jgi:hypothetical protein
MIFDDNKIANAKGGENYSSPKGHSLQTYSPDTISLNPEVNHKLASIFILFRMTNGDAILILSSMTKGGACLILSSMTKDDHTLELIGLCLAAKDF